MVTNKGLRPTITDTRPSYASIQEAAGHLHVNPRTIRRMIARGELTGFRLGPRVIRVDLNELQAIMRPIPSGKARLDG